MYLKSSPITWVIREININAKLTAVVKIREASFVPLVSRSITLKYDKTDFSFNYCEISIEYCFLLSQRFQSIKNDCNRIRIPDWKLPNGEEKRREKKEKSLSTRKIFVVWKFSKKKKSSTLVYIIPHAGLKLSIHSTRVVFWLISKKAKNPRYVRRTNFLVLIYRIFCSWFRDNIKICFWRYMHEYSVVSLMGMVFQAWIFFLSRAYRILALRDFTA